MEPYICCSDDHTCPTSSHIYVHLSQALSDHDGSKKFKICHASNTLFISHGQICFYSLNISLYCFVRSCVKVKEYLFTLLHGIKGTHLQCTFFLNLYCTAAPWVFGFWSSLGCGRWFAFGKSLGWPSICPQGQIEFSRDHPRAQIHLATPSAFPQIIPVFPHCLCVSPAAL